MLRRQRLTAPFRHLSPAIGLAQTTSSASTMRLLPVRTSSRLTRVHRVKPVSPLARSTARRLAHWSHKTTMKLPKTILPVPRILTLRQATCPSSRPLRPPASTRTKPSTPTVQPLQSQTQSHRSRPESLDNRSTATAVSKSEPAAR